MAVASPGRFRTTCKWVPVDLWTSGDLEAMRGGLERLQSRIEPTERWRMTVERRTPGGIPTPAVIAALAELIPARVDLTHPDKIVMVQLFSERTALSVLAPPDVFSLVPAPWQATAGTRAAASQRGGSVHEAPTMPSSPGTAGAAYP